MTVDDQYRLRVLFAGRVQGVGFRYTTRGIARRFPVRGFVRNLADGTVELVAVGVKSNVDDFLVEVRRRFADNIDEPSTISAELSAAEDFTGFTIR